MRDTKVALLYVTYKELILLDLPTIAPGFLAD